MQVNCAHMDKQILNNSPPVPKNLVKEEVLYKTHQIIDQTIFGV